MKILMTSESYLPKVGGAEVHVNNLFTKLKQLNHEVTLITNEKGVTSDEVIRIPWSGLSMGSIFIRIWKESKGVSIIHSHYSHRLAMLSGVVGRLKGIPVIVTLHGMGILNLPNSGLSARVKHSVYRFLSLKFCTHIISTSEDLAIVAFRYIKKDKLTVIMNGYDDVKFTPKDLTCVPHRDLQNKKIIMTVRRLVPKNGPQYLVETLPRILNKIPNAHYFVVGDGSLNSSLKSRAKDLGVSKHITFAGTIDNSLVPKYLAGADVVVFPSTAESSSIACAEAMGMGKSIVASRVGGLVELLGKEEERGYLVDLVPWLESNYNAPKNLPNSSYDNLANAVISALQDNEVNQIKKKNAIEFAKKELSWDSILEKTMGVYLSLRK